VRFPAALSPARPVSVAERTTRVRLAVATSEASAVSLPIRAPYRLGVTSNSALMATHSTEPFKAWLRVTGEEPGMTW
jgi:hypothetical protein